MDKITYINPETGLTEDIDLDYVEQDGKNDVRLSPRAVGELIPTTGIQATNLIGKERSIYDKNIRYQDIVDTPNGVSKHRHEEQPWYASLGSAVVQAGTTLVGQTMQGVGFMLDPEQMVNIATGSEKRMG